MGDECSNNPTGWVSSEGDADADTKGASLEGGFGAPIRVSKWVVKAERRLCRGEGFEEILRTQQTFNTRNFALTCINSLTDESDVVSITLTKETSYE